MPILKLSLRAWRRSPASQLVASLVSAALLLSVALLASLELAMVRARARVERENRISVFLSPEIAPGAEQVVTDRIVQAIGAHAESEVHAKFVPATDTIEALKKRQPELYAELRDLGDEGDSLVPRVVHLTASFGGGKLARALDELKKVPGVESAESTESRAAVVRPAVKALEWFVRLLIVGVSAGWILGWAALARSHAASLSGIAGPLRLWGARAMIARAPGMLAGLWVGIPSGLVAAAAYLLVARPALQKLSASTLLFESAALPGVAGAAALVAASILAGLVSGAIQGGSQA